MDPTCICTVIAAIVLLIVCKTFTMDSAVFFTVLIAAIILIMVVRFYENDNADLAGDLRDANNKNKNLQKDYDDLTWHVHCKGCPRHTEVHGMVNCGEDGSHCRDKYGRRMCNCELRYRDRREDPW